jgi:hypothetical protein
MDGVSKEKAPGDKPRATKTDAEGVIFNNHYSIMGMGVSYEPDLEAAAEYCELQAEYWNTRGTLHRLEMRLETYDSKPPQLPPRNDDKCSVCGATGLNSLPWSVPHPDNSADPICPGCIVHKRRKTLCSETAT